MGPTPPPRETIYAGTLWRNALGALATGAFLTFTNPFGATTALPLWGGFLYWTGLVAIGWFGGSPLAWALRRVAPRAPSWLIFALTVALVALAVTLAIILVQQALSAPAPRWFWPRLYGLVLGISIAVAIVASLAERAYAGGPGAVTHASPTKPARFLERLPAKLRGAQLYAVSAEDHYLRLHTTKGADLILMRLSDAIAELEGLEGAQTHRSWWVARDGYESARREGDRVILMLKSGAEAPVSRPNIKPLREAGWF